MKEMINCINGLMEIAYRMTQGKEFDIDFVPLPHEIYEIGFRCYFPEQGIFSCESSGPSSDTFYIGGELNTLNLKMGNSYKKDKEDVAFLRLRGGKVLRGKDNSIHPIGFCLSRRINFKEAKFQDNRLMYQNPNLPEYRALHVPLETDNPSLKDMGGIEMLVICELVGPQFLTPLELFKD